MKKIIFGYLIVLVFLITAIVYIISCRLEVESTVTSKVPNNTYIKEGGNVINFEDSLTISSKKETGEEKPLNYMYKTSGDKAYVYSLSFKENKLENESIINKNKEHEHASDALYLIFRESYPNISLESMGVNTEEEAYLIRQLAIWEIAARTEEAEYYTELSYVDSIKETIKLKNINIDIFEKAKQLVKFVEKNIETGSNYINYVPTLIFDNDRIDEKAKNIDSDIMVGPYSYNVETAKLTDVVITMEDENGNKINGKIVDINGFEIKDLVNFVNKDFYIRVPSSQKYIKFKVDAKCKRLTPTFYRDENCDYIVDGYTYSDMNVTQEIFID